MSCGIEDEEAGYFTLVIQRWGRTTETQELEQGIKELLQSYPKIEEGEETVLPGKPRGLRWWEVHAGVSAVTTVNGYRGHSAEIRCSYESGYESYMKYLCRGECSTLPWGNKDIPVQSGSTAEGQRFSLHDDTAARVFTITITDLRPEDAGKYWCVIQRAKPLPDLYTEVLLQVKV
ncbi:hypothetical protein NFI96_004651, partial [Prochilodus magdalenae]